jgi:hypothetical protein
MLTKRERRPAGNRSGFRSFNNSIPKRHNTARTLPASSRDEPLPREGASRFGDRRHPADDPHRALMLRSRRIQALGILRGYAFVTPSNGLEIDNTAVFVAPDGVASAALPNTPIIGRDGRQSVDKGQYIRNLSWSTRKQAEAFSAALTEQIRRRYLDDLDGCPQ